MRSPLPLLALFCTFCSAVHSQAPSVFVSAKMAVDRSQRRYKIDMKICTLKYAVQKKPSSSQTPLASLEALPASSFKCSNFPEADNSSSFNSFQFDTLLYAREKVIVLRVSDGSSAGWQPPMFIVLPIRQQAFVTRVELTDIVFRKGKVMYLNPAWKVDTGSQLTMELSLRNHPVMEKDSLPLRIKLDDF